MRIFVRVGLCVQAAFVNQSRLGIPLTVVSESLHSSMKGGTVYPAPPGLGSTWNADLVRAVPYVFSLLLPCCRTRALCACVIALPPSPTDAAVPFCCPCCPAP